MTVEEAPLEGVDTYPLSDQLTEMYSKGESDRRNVSVVSSGVGSEHTRIGCLNVSWYDPKRGKARVKQAGRGGIGTVLRDKKIKAIVVRYTGMRADSNDPADLKRIRTVGQRINKEIVELDDEQNKMRRVGTAHLVEIMDDYDLLPTHNFKFGSHPDSPKINSLVWDALFTQTHPDACIYGCTMACSKGVDGYLVRTGPYAGQIVTVDGPEYETVAGCGSNIGIFNPPDIIELNFYCDTYGIDSISFGTLTAFVMECYEAGILDKEKTGGLELKFGNADAAIELLHRMARGVGFGKIAGMGVRAMKAYFVEHFGADPAFVQDIGMENKGMEYSEYMVCCESMAAIGHSLSAICHLPFEGVNDDARNRPGNESGPPYAGRIQLSRPQGPSRLCRANPLRQHRHRRDRSSPRHRRDEAHLRRRQGVRAVAVVARGDRRNAVE